MRTGTCKFGVACKFNHPQPDYFGTMFPMEGFSLYGYSESSAPPVPPYTAGLPWPFSRSPSTLNPPMPGLQAYMPVVLPPTQSTVPMHQGWSTYMVGCYPLDFMYTVLVVLISFLIDYGQLYWYAELLLLYLHLFIINANSSSCISKMFFFQKNDFIMKYAMYISLHAFFLLLSVADI